MKNSVLSLVILFFTLITQAQTFEAHAIGGVSFSQIDGDKLSGYNKAGLLVGGATSFKLKNGWSIQQEIVYYMRGSRATDAQLTLDNFAVKRLDYIDLIALANYMLNDEWSIVGGLGYGAFVSIKSDVAADKSQYQSDWFGTLGAQYKLSDKWVAVLKGQYSIVSVFKSQNAFNNSLNLSLRYRLF